MAALSAKKSPSTLLNYSESRARFIFWFLVCSLVFLIAFYLVDHMFSTMDNIPGGDMIMLIPGIYILLPLSLIAVPFLGIYSIYMSSASFTARRFTSAKYYLVSIAIALIYVLLYWDHSYLFPAFFPQ